MYRFLHEKLLIMVTFPVCSIHILHSSIIYWTDGLNCWSTWWMWTLFKGLEIHTSMAQNGRCKVNDESGLGITWLCMSFLLHCVHYCLFYNNCNPCAYIFCSIKICMMGLCLIEMQIWYCLGLDVQSLCCLKFILSLSCIP